MSQKKLSEEQKARKRLREKERRERMKSEKAKTAKKAEPVKSPDPTKPSDNSESPTRKALDAAKEIEKLGGVEVLDSVVCAYAAAKLCRLVKKGMKCAITKCLDSYVNSTGFIVDNTERNAESAAGLAREAIERAVAEFAKEFKIESLKVCRRNED